MNNAEIADYLRRRASHLAQQGDNLYRIRAFRQAAMTILGLPTEVSQLVAERGPSGLAGLPGIGTGLAETIYALSNRPSAN